MPLANRNEELRVLTLLRVMDNDSRDAVLGTLPVDVRDDLRSRVLATRDRIPSATGLSRLLEEFNRLFSLAKSLGVPKLKLHRGDESDIESEDEELHIYELTGRTIRDLERMNLYQLSAALEEESPRAAAILIQTMSPSRSAQILQQIESEQRRLIAKEMARHPQVPAVVFERIAQSTLMRAIKLPAVERKAVDPVLRLADVFREIDKSDRRELLDSIRDENSSIAEQVQMALYRFEDLIELDDRQVQEILGRVDSTTLLEALFEADETIVEKVMKNLSRRASATLREELSYQRSVPEEQRSAAQKLIARTIGELEEAA